MTEKLIARLFRGECTQEELELLLDKIRRGEVKANQKIMQVLWEESQKMRAPEDEKRQKILDSILTEITPDSRQSRAKSYQEKGTKVFRIRQLRRFAAGLALFVSIGFTYLTLQPNTDVVQTSFGEQRSIDFDDGSSMKLNANSKASYTSDWLNREAREVWLEGEAYFKVEKKPATNQKFQVNTDHALVEVLGTTFNVNSSASHTTVYLEEGTIRLHLHDLDSIITMQPGDLITYAQEARTIHRRTSELTVYHTSWKDGVLTFENSPLREVLQKIEHLYGVDFTLSEEADYDRQIEFPLPIDSLETAISILDKTLTDLKIIDRGTDYLVKREKE